MKTMMKKCGVWVALAAALLITIALVIGCPVVDSGFSGYRPPAGMGAVKLNFSNEIMRATALPATADITSFLGGFTLEFTPTTPGAYKMATAAAVGTVTNPVTAPIDLIPGTYTLEVLAYLDVAKTQPAASYTQTNIIITGGGNTNITVTLKAIADGTGTGTFAWNINTTGVTGTITAATMTLTEIGGAALAPVNLLPANWNDSDDYDSGYYYVDFSLTVGGTTMTFRHILHVYENMTSTFTYTFTNDHFGVITGTVTATSFTYEPPTNNPPIIAVTKDVAANGTLTGTGTAADPYMLSFGAFPANTAVEADEITITVTATTGTYASITGQFRGVVQTPTLGVFTVTGGVAPFTAGGPYQFSVTGIATDGDAYSGEVFISIVDES